MADSDQRPPLTFEVLRAGLKNDLVARLSAVLTLAAVGVLLFLPALERTLLLTRFVTACFLVLVVLALRHGLSLVPNRGERSFWQDLSIGYGAWLGADLALLGSDLLDGAAGGLVAEWGAAVFYVFLVRGVERQPHRQNGQAVGLTRQLSLLSIAAFVFGLLTYFLLIPSMTGRGGHEALLPSVYFYGTLDLLLTLRLALLIRSTGSTRWRTLYTLLMATTAAMAAGDLVGSFTSLAEANYFYSASMIAVIAAARLKLYDFPRENTVPPSSVRDPSFQSWQSVVYTLTLPMVHLAVYKFELLDLANRSWRESFVLAWTPLLGSIALLQQRQLEKERQRVVDELETRNAEMEDFAYTVSHDLKSPLVTIQGFLGFLGKDLSENNHDRVVADLQQIKNATGQMGRLLEELLELSRVGRVVNPPKAVSLRNLAREAVELVGAEISDRSVEVVTSPELPVVVGDRTRLLQVFQNLVENAVKYMGAQSDPRVEIAVKRIDDENVYYVLDNGIGIDPRYQEKVFGLFERLDTTIEGTGVGLALVRRIIEFHGGRIWIESEGQGRGCAICFTLGAHPV